MRRATLFILAVSLLGGTRDARAAQGPSDVVVYANKIPAYKVGGAPFENPFDEGTTRIVVEPITTPTPLRHPRGSFAWADVAWAKYIFMTNYEEGGAGLVIFPPYPAVEDQRIGVFDTERRTFCELDVDAAVAANAAVEMVAVAEPAARKTRIYFIGFVHGALIPDPPYLPPAFGYIEADLDRDPCQPYDPGSPTAGWRVVGFTAKHLNDKAAAGGVQKPCDNTCIFGCRNWCDWDGMALLDRNTVVVGEWNLTRIAAIRVEDDPGGANPLDLLSVPAVYQMPAWQPTGPGGACFFARPVKNPGVDPTRTSASDYRFTWGFDVSCFEGVPGCGSCAGASYGNPVQEFRFNAGPPASITATSRFFQAPFGGYMRSPGFYDSLGNLWVSENSSLDAAGGPNPADVQMVIYKKHVDGEHAYYDTSSPGGAAVVLPDNPSTDVLPYSGVPIWNRVLSAAERGPAYFMGVGHTVQRAFFSGGNWGKDPIFDAHVGASVLPAEPNACNGPTPADGGGIAWNVVIGGSPPSLWTSPLIVDAQRRACAKNDYLVRVPIPSDVPDGVVTARPGMVWDDVVGRLWLTREQGGVMQFRVRDDGFWSSWATVPSLGIPAGTSLVGGGALLANGTSLPQGPTIEIFVRATDGRVYMTNLASSLACAPATCQWTSWSPLPALPNGNVVTHDPAAAYQGTTKATVVVKSSNGNVYATMRDYGGTSFHLWKRLTGLNTDGAPSVAWNPLDAKAWVVAKDVGDPGRRLKYNRISGYFDQSGWQWVQNTLPAEVPSWGAEPAIAFDGARMRIFVGSAGSPPATYQSAFEGAAWTLWRRLSTRSYAFGQPAVANVNGDVNVVTRGYAGNLHEQAME